jgi:transglutaminase-like putative cysteine protease
VKTSDRVALFSGITGLGLIILGGSMYYRQRKMLSGGFGLGRGKVAQAPVIGHYSDGNMKTTLRASEDMPIEQRLATIQDLVHRSVQDPEMRKLALKITARCPERDGLCESEAIYNYVKSKVRYTGDVAPIAMGAGGAVEGIDLYQSARRTLEFGGGDCDDQSILVSTLLALNGITPRLRVVKQSKNEDWSHIYPVAMLPKFSPGKAVALDTTLPGNNKFGVEAPHAKAIDFPA